MGVILYYHVVLNVWVQQVICPGD